MMRDIKRAAGGSPSSPVRSSCTPAASPYFQELIRAGYVDVLLAGNALAVHDVEQALFGTSLGVDLDTGKAIEGGHRHHMRAINTICRAGGLRQAVEQGVLTSGVMYECIRHGVDYVLAGSIRDDGPLPDTIMDLRRGAGSLCGGARGREAGARAVDDAARHRRGQHAAVVGEDGLRRHQSGGRHQARRPRLVADASASSPTSACSCISCTGGWSSPPDASKNSKTATC